MLERRQPGLLRPPSLLIPSGQQNQGSSWSDSQLMFNSMPSFILAANDLGAGEVDLVLARGTGSATFTRATTATTVDSAGTIVSVASGTARSWYNPTTLVYGGDLAEGARTKLGLQSEDFNTTWVPSDATIANVASPTSPYGTGTADSFTESTDVGVTSHQDVQGI